MADDDAYQCPLSKKLGRHTHTSVASRVLASAVWKGMKGFACIECAELEGQVCHGCNGCACVKGPGGRKSCNIHKAAYESDPLEDPLWTRGGDGVG